MSTSAGGEPFDRVDVIRLARRIALRPETRDAVRPHQVLFLKGFCFQLGSLVAAFVEGAAFDPFHASSSAPLALFLLLLGLSVGGTAVMLVAMRRRESFVAGLARQELRAAGHSRPAH